MTRPNTKEVNRSQAERLKTFLSFRLIKGKGAGGKVLAPKRWPDGKPLGGEIRSTLLKGKVSARKYGFTLDYSRLAPVTGFHFGFKPQQVAREIVDFPDAVVKENADEYLDLLHDYGRSLGAFKGSPLRAAVK